MCFPGHIEEEREKFLSESIGLIAKRRRFRPLAFSFLLAWMLIWTLSPASAAERWLSLEDGKSTSGLAQDFLAPDAPEFLLTAAGPMETVVDVRLPGLYAEDVFLQGKEYRRLRIPGGAKMGKVGYPALPLITRLLAVPRGARVSARLETEGQVRFDSPPVAPAQPSRYRDETEDGEFAYNEAYYQSLKAYPEQGVQVSGPWRMRDLDLVRISLRPVIYDPKQSSIIVTTQMRLHLTFDRLPEQVRAISSDFHQLYSKQVADSGRMLASEKLEQEPGHILIITHQMFIESDSLAEYVAWKRACGNYVTLLSTGEAGSTPEEIGLTVQNAYDGWELPPSVLLLVGDAAQVPTNTGIADCDSDYLYTLLDGDDLLPDIFVGRISAQTEQQLAAQIDKILAYEQDPPLNAVGEQFDDALLISSSQGLNELNDDTRIERVAAALRSGGYDQVTDLYHKKYDDTIDNIVGAIDEGRGLLMYMGHGNGFSWTTTRPDFTNEHVAALNNAPLPPVVMDVSCRNGAFRALEPSFAELWMRKGPDGAVAIYSSSTDTAWDESAELGEGFVYSLIAGADNLGETILAGMLHLIDIHGDTIEVHEVLQQYVFFGDPSSGFRKSAPEELEVLRSEQVYTGTANLELAVSVGIEPVHGAIVSATLPDDEQTLISTGVTDATGEAVLELELTEPGSLHVVVQAPDTVPTRFDIPIVVGGCGSLKFDPADAKCSSSLEVRLMDADLNQQDSTRETVQVTIVPPGDAPPLFLELTETEESSGIFKGSLQLGTDLTANHGDGVQVFYSDDDCQGTPAEKTAEITLDCLAPTIDQVQVQEVGEDYAIISWQTDEATLGSLQMEEENQNILSEHYSQYHLILIENLLPETSHHFSLLASDAAGNETLADNDGQFYSFTTLALTVEDGDEELEYEPDLEWEADLDEFDFPEDEFEEQGEMDGGDPDSPMDGDAEVDETPVDGDEFEMSEDGDLSEEESVEPVDGDDDLPGTDGDESPDPSDGDEPSPDGDLQCPSGDCASPEDGDDTGSGGGSSCRQSSPSGAFFLIFSAFAAILWRRKKARGEECETFCERPFRG